MKHNIILFCLVLFVSCEKEDSQNDNTNIIGIYDKEYFTGLKNNTLIQVEDTLDQFIFLNDILDIEGYAMTDSVLWRFGTVIKDNQSSTVFRIHFFIRELFSNLDTSRLIYHKIKYKYLSVLQRRFLTDDFSLQLDSINYNRPGYIFKSNLNQPSAIVIELQEPGKEYSSFKNKSIKDFEILESYIKPVIINIHEDGSGYDIDSVLYIKGKFNCQYVVLNDTVKLNQCEFKSAIFIKDFNEK